MKILKKFIEKDKSGYVRVQADDLEDIWHLYNLICKGDKVQASTERRIQNESLTGTTNSERIKITLTIAVETVDPDLQRGTLRLSGRTVEESKWVKMGSYHTLDLEMFKPFAVHKEEWDALALSQIEEMTQARSKAEVAAIVLQDGLANICLITDSLTVVVQRIEVSIPKKRKGSNSQQQKAFTRFYDQIYQAILQHFDLEKLKCIIIGSPGFLKESLFQYIFEQAVKEDRKPLLESRSKFTLVHCSSGHKMALNEALKDSTVINNLADTKYSQELKVMNSFFDMLSNDPDRAYYGIEHVSAALDYGAIATLLITDGLFRSADVASRKKYIKMVQDVKQQGGKVYIFSTSHVTGEQLQQFTGIAAILTYPIPDFDE